MVHKSVFFLTFLFHTFSSPFLTVNLFLFHLRSSSFSHSLLSIFFTLSFLSLYPSFCFSVSSLNLVFATFRSSSFHSYSCVSRFLLFLSCSNSPQTTPFLPPPFSPVPSSFFLINLFVHTSHLLISSPSNSLLLTSRP